MHIYRKPKTQSLLFLATGLLAVVAALMVSPSASRTAFADHGMTREECSRSFQAGNMSRAEFDGCVAHADRDRTYGMTREECSRQLGSGVLSRSEFEACTAEADATEAANCEEEECIVQHLKTLINVLSGLVGITVTIMIVWGGIQYSAARDNPQQAAQAKEHIKNAVLALVLYVFVVVGLNYLIPGGLF